MTSVVSLASHDGRGDPFQPAVDQLRELLAQAEAGELQSFIIGIVWRTGSIGMGFAKRGEPGSTFLLASAANLCAHRMNAELLELHDGAPEYDAPAA